MKQPIFLSVLFLSLQVLCSPVQEDNRDDRDHQVVDTAVGTCVGVAGALVVAQIIWNLIKWPIFGALSIWTVNSMVNNWWGKRTEFEREMRVDGLQGGYPPRPRVIHENSSHD
jgi:hypothetical protein